MIHFGPSGNSLSFDGKHTEDAALWVKERGLDYYEYSFGRGVNMGKAKARSIGAAFASAGVGISVHAPYYINFASTEEEKASASFRYILESAAMVREMGGSRVIFHPGSQGKQSRESAVNLIKTRLFELAARLRENGFDDIIVCPETMGKLGQIGTVEEIAAFCETDKIFVPCVDFGHVNAREHGSLKTEDDYLRRLDYLLEKLGEDRMKHFHIHFSKIQYSDKGEVRHLTFADDVYGPEFAPLASALKKRALEPVVICESAGTQAEDAMEMRKMFEEAEI